VRHIPAISAANNSGSGEQANDNGHDRPGASKAAARELFHERDYDSRTFSYPIESEVADV
jgi:hypothetical protein